MPYKDKEKKRAYDKEWQRRKKLGLPTQIINKPKPALKTCTICGESIPNWVEINGKKRCLHMRKRCLKCVPFGSIRLGKERKPNSLFCIKCRNPLYGNQIKYCSQKCRNNYTAIMRGRRLKQKAIDYKGGECEFCGYNKCNRALQFHHLDPETKDFKLSADRLRQYSWERIKEELDKCILFCANCHAEIHARSAVV